MVIFRRLPQTLAFVLCMFSLAACDEIFKPLIDVDFDFEAFVTHKVLWKDYWDRQLEENKKEPNYSYRLIYTDDTASADTVIFVVKGVFDHQTPVKVENITESEEAAQNTTAQNTTAPSTAAQNTTATADTTAAADIEKYLTISDIYEEIGDEYKEFNNTRRSKDEWFVERIEINKYDWDEDCHIPLKITRTYHVPSSSDKPAQIILEIKEYAETQP
jgi:hypothetical protein